MFHPRVRGWGAGCLSLVVQGSAVSSRCVPMRVVYRTGKVPSHFLRQCINFRSAPHLAAAGFRWSGIRLGYRMKHTEVSRAHTARGSQHPGQNQLLADRRGGDFLGQTTSRAVSLKWGEPPVQCEGKGFWIQRAWEKETIKEMAHYHGRLSWVLSWNS